MYCRQTKVVEMLTAWLGFFLTVLESRNLREGNNYIGLPVSQTPLSFFTFEED